MEEDVRGVTVEYVIAPLASRDTALELKRRLEGENVVALPILGHRLNRRAVERAMELVKGGGTLRSIFTSKTAVKALWRYVEADPELAGKVFKNSIAIGPSTAGAIYEIYEKLGISSSVTVPRRHNSEGILELLEEGGSYILWCSESVNRALADAMLRRGDIVAPIYRIKVNGGALRRLRSILANYRKRYLVFTSVSSCEAWKEFVEAFPLPGGEIYAIAISERVAIRLKGERFKRIYVYGRADLRSFPEFIRSVTST